MRCRFTLEAHTDQPHLTPHRQACAPGHIQNIGLAWFFGAWRARRAALLHRDIPAPGPWVSSGPR